MIGILSPRYKLVTHVVQIFLIIVVLVLSIVRMFKQPAGAPRTRANTMSLGMSAKSLVIILYQLLTEHIRALQRWSSLKVYAILNAMEIVFWLAVAFLLIQSNINFCSGLSCTLSWIVVSLGIVMSLLAVYMTIVTFLDFRNSRSKRLDMDDSTEVQSVNSYRAPSNTPEASKA
ncbi:unnamed protein product [Clonostachys chloroleuca]|uniref:MARVEL domain-containing protein n=1 Tax=Clonostachys chloroleuca TaxID=1926264 RepID=A0AA35LR00_9HYPO|nr:unnamed protein product [Clonostachys chloroleuca]